MHSSGGSHSLQVACGTPSTFASRVHQPVRTWAALPVRAYANPDPKLGQAHLQAGGSAGIHMKILGGLSSKHAARHKAGRPRLGGLPLGAPLMPLSQPALAPFAVHARLAVQLRHTR